MKFKTFAACIVIMATSAVSGTMKNYFRDELFKGRVVAKTGSINIAKSFAGYVTTNSVRRVMIAVAG